ncbi:MAG: SCO family protein, partial [Sphingomonadaceae bacterium]
MLRRFFAISAIVALLGSVAGSNAAPGGSPWGAGYLPNVPVITQDGKTLQFYDDVIKDKFVVISFIYTTCRDICPVMTARLAQAKDKLGDLVGSRIFFVSISIEPEVDTPDKLKNYAEVFQTGPGWLFLTGKPADINVLRHKLGERSRKVFEHRSDIMLGNDATGEWAKDSAFSDLNTLAMTIKAMDPVWRNQMGSPETAAADGATARGERPIAATSTGLPGQALFIKACAACHTIGGGKRVGPDLEALTARRDRGWIVNYLMEPDQMRAKKDP